MKVSHLSLTHRVILGEWNWLITGIGVVALGARMVWDARPQRDSGWEAS